MYLPSSDCTIPILNYISQNLNSIGFVFGTSKIDIIAYIFDHAIKNRYCISKKL